MSGGRRGAPAGTSAPSVTSAVPATDLTTLAPVRPEFAAMTTTYYPTGARRRHVYLGLPGAQRERDRALAAGCAVSVDLVELRPVSGTAQREAAQAALTADDSAVA